MGGYLTHPGLNLVVLSFWLNGMEIVKMEIFAIKIVLCILSLITLVLVVKPLLYISDYRKIIPYKHEFVPSESNEKALAFA